MSAWPFVSAWPLKARGAAEGLSSKRMLSVIACTLPPTVNVFAPETLLSGPEYTIKQ